MDQTTPKKLKLRNHIQRPTGPVSGSCMTNECLLYCGNEKKSGTKKTGSFANKSGGKGTPS